MPAAAARERIRAHEVRTVRAVKSLTTGQRVSLKRLMQEQAWALLAALRWWGEYVLHMMDY